MDIDALELHDAIVVDASIDYAAKRLTLRLDIYEEASYSHRTPIELVFNEMTSLSHVVDFDRLEANRFAGNVNYWLPGNDQAQTYIYLTDGVIAIGCRQPPVAQRVEDVARRE
jgi:hypothetical protein